MKEFNLIIVGVGGQGAITASDIIGKAAVNQGLSVQSSETHGMAQRGGSVINHVRLNCKYGSLIPEGRADAILGLEPIEALRGIEFLSPEGVVVINTNPVLPISTLSGSLKYPEVETILTQLRSRCKQLIAIDAESLAIEAGHPLTSNVVMIGALSNYLPLDIRSLEESITRIVPPKTIEVNLSAFRLGRKQVE